MIRFPRLEHRNRAELHAGDEGSNGKAGESKIRKVNFWVSAQETLRDGKTRTGAQVDSGNRQGVCEIANTPPRTDDAGART